MNNDDEQKDIFNACMSESALISMENSDYIAEAFPFKVPSINEEAGQLSVRFAEMAIFLFDKNSGNYNYTMVSPLRSPAHGRKIDANDVIKAFQEDSRKSLARMLRKSFDSSTERPKLDTTQDYIKLDELFGYKLASQNRALKEHLTLESDEFVSKVREDSIEKWHRNVKAATARGFAETWRKQLVGEEASKALDLAAKMEKLLNSEDEHLYSVSHIRGESFSVARNRLQLLEALGWSKPAWNLLLSDKKISAGIDDGKPLKETLDHLPLASLSKRSINNFLSNISSYSEAKARGLISHENKEIEFFTEKGPVFVSSQSDWLIKRVRYSQAAINMLAVMTAIPEASFSSPARDDMPSNIVNIMDTRFLAQALVRSCFELRDNKASAKELFSGVRQFLKKHNNNLEHYDLEMMATERMVRKLISAISTHLTYSGANSRQGEVDINQLPHLDVVLPPSINYLYDAGQRGKMKDLFMGEEYIHKNINELYKAGKPKADIQWEATSPDYNSNSYTIRSITSNSALTEEGQRMNHCVGTYLQPILEHESYIFNISKGGLSIGTLELKGHEPGNVKQVQLRGPSNKRCSPEVQEIVNNFISDINNNKIPFDFNPCEDREASFDGLTVVEEEEVELGLTYTDRKFILKAMETVEGTAEWINVIDLFRKDGKHSNADIDDLERDYLAYKNLPEMRI